MAPRILKLNPIPVKNEIVIDSIFTFYYYEHGKNFSFEGEMHDFWEMVYVDSGTVLAKTENACHILSQGSVIFHKPMEFHALEATDNKPHNIMVITFGSASPAMDFFKDKILPTNNRQRRILSHFTEEMSNYFKKGFEPKDTDKVDEKKFGSMQAAIAHFEIFLIELIRENSETPMPRRTYVSPKNSEGIFTDAVKSYLGEMVEYPLNLDMVCDRFKVSKSHLCSVFKEETGESVMDYFINLKISRAKVLIREGNMNLTQIAEKLGYSGIHHFSRMFKARVNMSPANYAKSVK